MPIVLLLILAYVYTIFEFGIVPSGWTFTESPGFSNEAGSTNQRYFHVPQSFGGDIGRDMGEPEGLSIRDLPLVDYIQAVVLLIYMLHKTRKSLIIVLVLSIAWFDCLSLLLLNEPTAP